MTTPLRRRPISFSLRTLFAVLMVMALAFGGLAYAFRDTLWHDFYVGWK